MFDDLSFRTFSGEPLVVVGLLKLFRSPTRCLRDRRGGARAYGNIVRPDISPGAFVTTFRRPGAVRVFLFARTYNNCCKRKALHAHIKTVKVYIYTPRVLFRAYNFSFVVSTRQAPSFPSLYRPFIRLCISMCARARDGSIRAKIQ